MHSGWMPETFTEKKKGTFLYIANFGKEEKLIIWHIVPLEDWISNILISGKLTWNHSEWKSIKHWASFQNPRKKLVHNHPVFCQNWSLNLGSLVVVGGSKWKYKKSEDNILVSFHSTFCLYFFMNSEWIKLIINFDRTVNVSYSKFREISKFWNIGVNDRIFWSPNMWDLILQPCQAAAINLLECVFSGEPKLNATHWNSEKMSKNF